MGDLDLSINVPGEVLDKIASEVADRVERILEERLEAGSERLPDRNQPLRSHQRSLRHGAPA
jgi:hypothetical protein